MKVNEAHVPVAASDVQLDLRVGALVVYGGHGVGRVSGKRTGGAGEGSSGSVTVELADGLSVTLPLERALTCLRAVADADELARVEQTLRRPRPADEDAAGEKSWLVRATSTRTKIAAGEAVGLAEVVRDAVARQRRASSGTLSPQERALYLKARRLLAAELGVATATDEAEADAWIEAQLEASASENETE